MSFEVSQLVTPTVWDALILALIVVNRKTIGDILDITEGLTIYQYRQQAD